MKINWKVRIKNPLFWAQVGAAVLIPILSYMGLTPQDMTSWSALFNTLMQAVLNPYVLFLVASSVFNAIIDPTTKGLNDSENALTYTEPK